jgi:ribosome modulation factor
MEQEEQKELALAYQQGYIAGIMGTLEAFCMIIAEKEEEEAKCGSLKSIN